MENSVEDPQKLKNGMISFSLPEIYQKEMKTPTRKDICNPTFLATFSVAKTWTQPK